MALPFMEAPSASFRQIPPSGNSLGYREHQFQPYDSNGGTTIGISGADYAILAGDTRCTTGYSIHSRHVPKLYKIGGSFLNGEGATMVLAAVGCLADSTAVAERLNTNVELYRLNHGKTMSVASCAQALARLLYSRRFFPFYSFCILGGINGEDGSGAIYSYDPLGSYELHPCAAFGAASSLVMPVLDSQVSAKNQYDPTTGQGHQQKKVIPKPLAKDEAIRLVQDSFAGAVERHIESGDYLQLMIITKYGIQESTSNLKRD